MNYLEYKGYNGSIEYSPADELLFGKVLGVKGLISYEGKTGQALKKDFEQAIDAYLKSCDDSGIPPEKPFKGSFSVRIPAALHQQAALLAIKSQTSLNSFVAEAIRSQVQTSN